MQQGDEAGILVKFLYARLRGNSSGLPVVSMPAAPQQATPCIGFSISPEPSTQEQGGDILYSTFRASVVVIGAENVDNLEPLRAPAREIAANLRADSSQLGTRIDGGTVLSATIAMPISQSHRDRQGILRWYHGHQWIIKVQPDESAN